jgi:MFS family permease
MGMPVPPQPGLFRNHSADTGLKFIRTRLLHLNVDNPDDRNAWYLCVEIFWAAFLASAATFNGILAVRLGASNESIGLLTSIPALLAILISIPSGRFLQSRTHKKPWILWGLAIFRTGYLLVALVPLLKVFNMPVGSIAVWLIILFSMPAQFFTIGFIPFLAETIPEEQRAAVFAARNIILGVTTSIFTLAAGLWLNLVLYPVNYQILYAATFGVSMFSLYYLVKIDARERPSIQPQKVKSIREQLRGYQKAFATQPGFVRIVRNTFLYGIGIWLATPIYVLFYVKTLGADEAWIGLNGTVAALVSIFGFIFWRWAMARLGEPLTLKINIILAGLYPLLVGIFHNLTLTLLATALNGVVSAGISLSHLNTLLKVMPEDQRPEYHAIFSTFMNLGAFICPLVAVAFTNLFDFGPILIASGALCILGSASFWIWPIQTSVP